MTNNQRRYQNTLLVMLLTVLLFTNYNTSGQEQEPYVRIAKIEVDSARIVQYNAALREHAEAAVRKEAGVLSLYAVYDKERPTHVTVFEIYASVAAYQSHIKTAHFLQYKSTVKDMVTSLVLTDVVPIALQTKYRERKL